MADNYLEKRMADYREGRLGVAARRRPSAPALPPVHVHLAHPEPLVAALRALDVPVSFSGVEQAAGARLAQSTGSTYVPKPLSDALALMTQRRGTIPAAVTVDTDATLVVSPGHIIPSDIPAADAARLIVALASVATPLRVLRR